MKNKKKSTGKNRSGSHQDLAVEMLSADLLSGGRFIKQCCVCKKLKLGEFWVNAAVAAPGGEKFSHGYCPSCFRAIMHTIDLFPGELKN
jgi:hypothetical protein